MHRSATIAEAKGLTSTCRIGMMSLVLLVFVHIQVVNILTSHRNTRYSYTYSLVLVTFQSCQSIILLQEVTIQRGETHTILTAGVCMCWGGGYHLLYIYYKNWKC